MPTPSNEQPSAPLSLAGGRWRTPPHIHDRLRTVADLRQRGHSQIEIAGQLGVSASTISRDLSRLDLIDRHQRAEITYGEHLQSLLSLREVEQFCWALMRRYRDDPDHAAVAGAAATTIVEARCEARLVLAAARDPYADAVDDDDDDDDADADAEALLEGLPDDSGADPGGRAISELRRDAETEFSRYISPKRVAVISRGLALAERADRDTSPGDAAPGA